MWFRGEEPKPAETDEEYATKLAAWKKKDAKGQRIIGTPVANKMLFNIMDCKTACEMWNKLHMVFEQKTETSILYLQQKFFVYTRDPEDSIALFMSKMEEMVRQLSDLGAEIAESMVITKIIMALPADYNHFVSAWESTSKTERTLDVLRTRLMIEENRMSMMDVAYSEALLAKQKGSKATTNFQGKGENSQASKNKRKKSLRGTCLSCNKTGHWKSECPDENKSEKSEAFMCAPSAMNDGDSFYLDSGATELFHHNFQRV